MRRILLLSLLVLSALGGVRAQDSNDSVTSMLLASDGNVYATEWGPESSGFIRLGEYGNFTLLNSGFAKGILCLEGPDGNLYGVMDAQVVRLTLTGESSTFVNLPEGSSLGCPAMASDGNYYGASASGGSSGQGFLYQVTAAGNATIFYNFNGTTDGGGTTNTPVEGSDGNLYLYNSANLLKYSRTTGLTVVPESVPVSGQLVEGPDGNFYGLSQWVAVEQIQPSGVANAIYQTNNIANETLNGPFVDGDGTLSLVQSVPYSTTYCTEQMGEYLSVFPISLSGTVYPQYFQIGPAAYGYVSTYYASNSFLSGDGTYYGILNASYAEAEEYCAGYIEADLFTQAPPVVPTPPIQMTLSKTHVLPGASVNLSWQVNNAFSKTMQQCYGAGELSGKLELSGSRTVIAAENRTGAYLYSIVCGGTEVGLATLTASSTVAMTLTSSSTNVLHGLPVTLTAQIAGVGVPGPTGRVTFRNGSQVIGTAAVNSAGTATLEVSTHGQPAGSYNVSASYPGDVNYGPGAAAPIAITIYVGQEKTTLNLSTQTPTIVAGQNSAYLIATATGKISGQPPSGSVDFRVGSHDLGSALLGATSQTASSAWLLVSTANVPAGTFSVTATYAGDGWNEPATSNAVQITILVEQVGVAATPNPVPAGDAFTLTGVVNSSKGAATGTVTFFAGAQQLGSAALNGRGAASVVVPAGTLATGSYSVTAAYSGDGQSPAGTSAAITVVVQ